MIIPLNIPVNNFFNDEELIAFHIANPELSVERAHNGRLYIKVTPTFALSSSNNSESIQKPE